MTDLRGKRIIITGATGFIGRHVTKELLSEGALVTAVVRSGSPGRKYLPEGEGLTVLESSLSEIGGKLPPADVFLHFAWAGVNREEIDSPVVQKKNIEDSLQCLLAARDAGCTLFMDAGSRVEYGITEDGVMEESMECRPVNEYGKAKLLFYEKAAALCRTFGMTFYHMRFFSVYGTDDHPWSIISTLTRELPKGGKVSLSACRHRWNFMEVGDAARAVTELIRHSDAFPGVVQPVNIAGKDTRVLRDFVTEIDDLTAHRGTLEFGTFVQAKEGALSICPELHELEKLTEGGFSERETFASGIKKILKNGESE